MQVFNRLHRLGLTMSHSTVIRLLDQVGNLFDRDVKQWRDSFLPELELKKVFS